MVFFILAGGFKFCDSMSRGGAGHSEITIKCWAENEHSRITTEVWEEFKEYGNKDSSDEEQP